MMTYFGRMKLDPRSVIRRREAAAKRARKNKSEQTSKKQKTEDKRIARQKKAQEKRQDEVVKKINDLELSNLFPYLKSAKIQVVKNNRIRRINSIIADMIKEKVTNIPKTSAKNTISIGREISKIMGEGKTLEDAVNAVLNKRKSTSPSESKIPAKTSDMLERLKKRAEDFYGHEFDEDAIETFYNNLDPYLSVMDSKKQADILNFIIPTFYNRNMENEISEVMNYYRILKKLWNDIGGDEQDREYFVSIGTKIMRAYNNKHDKYPSKEYLNRLLKYMTNNNLWGSDNFGNVIEDFEYNNYVSSSPEPSPEPSSDEDNSSIDELEAAHEAAWKRQMSYDSSSSGDSSDESSSGESGTKKNVGGTVFAKNQITKRLVIPSRRKRRRKRLQVPPGELDFFNAALKNIYGKVKQLTPKEIDKIVSRKKTYDLQYDGKEKQKEDYDVNLYERAITHVALKSSTDLQREVEAIRENEGLSRVDAFKKYLMDPEITSKLAREDWTDFSGAEELMDDSNSEPKNEIIDIKSESERSGDESEYKIGENIEEVESFKREIEVFRKVNRIMSDSENPLNPLNDKQTQIHIYEYLDSLGDDYSEPIEIVLRNLFKIKHLYQLKQLIDGAPLRKEWESNKEYVTRLLDFVKIAAITNKDVMGEFGLSTLKERQEKQLEEIQNVEEALDKNTMPEKLEHLKSILKNKPVNIELIRQFLENNEFVDGNKNKITLPFIATFRRNFIDFINQINTTVYGTEVKTSDTETKIQSDSEDDGYSSDVQNEDGSIDSDDDFYLNETGVTNQFRSLRLRF